MRIHNICIADLSETNLHYAHTQFNKAIHIVITNVWSTQLVTSEKNVSLTSKYKPGGNSSIITNTLSKKVTKSDQDPEGLERWYFTITPKRAHSYQYIYVIQNNST